jgi:hypothetical protein
MSRKWKAAIIAAAVLLLVGTLAFAQAGASPRADEQQTPFDLDQRAYCGGPRSGLGGYGGCGGQGGYNGNPDDNGNGGGFSCH